MAFLKIKQLTAIIGIFLIAAAGFLRAEESEAGASEAEADEGKNWLSESVEELLGEVEVHGFWEGRGGFRLLEDKYEKDMSVMETRLQLDVSAFPEWGDLKFKGDTLGDFVTGDTHFDIREVYFAGSPLEFMDAKIGRQVLTWGTGDLLFINDLFPKDWQSFLIGRDSEYLKAPSDAAKLSFFSDWANLDFVYTPRFDHDRFINGERISFYNNGLGRISGEDAVVHTDKPDRWFSDDELAVRIYRNIENYELALYGYRGYWKSPGGMNSCGQAIFPDLNVYGGSVRGALGKGICNFEFGYYESDDDQRGSDPMLKNSELRFLAGYTQELAKELTGSIQYYVEQMTDYDNYRDSLPAGAKSRDRSRHLITVRLTKLLLNQNLRVGIFGYFSPSDQDAYLRPNVHYKISDDLAVEAGANVFLGDYSHTFFGQFHDNTNIYTAVRYNF